MPPQTHQNCWSILWYGQHLRVRHICSRFPDFCRHATEIIFNYAKRGYPANLLEEKLQLVLRKDRHSLLHPPRPPVTTDDPEQDLLFSVVTYHPRNPPILDTLNENWKILECIPTLKCIAQKPVKIGFCRNPNPRDLLVHSRITYPPNTYTGNQSLPNPKKISSKTDCDYCPLMDKSGICFSSVTTHKYIVPSSISCKLNNLVYLLTCTRCQLQHISETYCSLKERLSEHLRDIGHQCNPEYAPPSVIQKRPTTVARHFGRDQHTLDDLNVQILELICKNPLGPHTDDFRETREHSWIHHLRTLQPLSLNAI